MFFFKCRLLFQMRFVGFESEPFEYAFTPKDVILYALGVGASTKDSLDFLYEGAESFGALTSFGVIPAMGGLTGLISGMVPGLDIDLSKVITFASFIRHEGNIKKHNMNMRKIDHLFL